MFIVEVNYTVNGVEKVDRYYDRQVHSCIRATKRANKGCLIRGTTTRELTRKDKCIPDPPSDFQYARFKCTTKKNRWGRDIAVPEEMNYEVLNGEDDEKVSIQKWK